MHKKTDFLYTLPSYYATLCALMLICALFMTGCASYNAIIAEKSAQASDQATEAALWSLCNAMPVGAIKRRFKTEEEQQAYNDICPTPALP